ELHPLLFLQLLQHAPAAIVLLAPACQLHRLRAGQQRLHRALRRARLGRGEPVQRAARGGQQPLRGRVGGGVVGGGVDEVQAHGHPLRGEGASARSPMAAYCSSQSATRSQRSPTAISCRRRSRLASMKAYLSWHDTQCSRNSCSMRAACSGSPSSSASTTCVASRREWSGLARRTRAGTSAEGWANTLQRVARAVIAGREWPCAWRAKASATYGVSRAEARCSAAWRRAVSARGRATNRSASAPCTGSVSPSCSAACSRARCAAGSCG